jgi:hypothetical protein
LGPLEDEGLDVAVAGGRSLVPGVGPVDHVCSIGERLCGPANLRRCRIRLLLYRPSPMIHRTNCQKLEAQFTDEPLLPVSPTGLADADGGRSLHPASVPGDPPGGSVNPGAGRGLALPPAEPFGNYTHGPKPSTVVVQEFW